MNVAPSAWAAVSAILAAFGVAFEPSDTVKAVVAAAGGLVLAVYQWQHHRTVRHENELAASLASQRAELSPAAPVSVPPPMPAPSSTIVDAMTTQHVPGRAGTNNGGTP